MIDQPGVYDIDDAAYHADPVVSPSLSSGVAKVLIGQSPAHAWTIHPRLNPDYKPLKKREFDVGSAAHDLILRGQSNVTIIEAENFRSKAAQEARDAAYAAGKTPLLQADWNDVLEMAREIRKSLDAHRDASNAFKEGKAEQALIWQDGGVWCRARLDWFPLLGNDPYDDLKTTTDANPNAWQRSIYDYGYDIQCAFYRRGIRATLGIEEPVFRFIVVEKNAPYAVSVIRLSPQALDLAEQKVQRALDLWKWCLENNRWDGYPPITIDIGPPAWEVNKWAEREVARQTMQELEVDYYGI